MLNVRIGLFLGIRQIQRASIWSTILITAIITFTFLNLVAVSGVLTGIVEGALQTTRAEATGDLTLKALPDEERILKTEELLKRLDTYGGIESYSPHYTGLATIEANYTERRDLNAEPDTISVTVSGIDIEKERLTTGLHTIIGEGEYFVPGESGYILIGMYNLERYAEKFGGAFQTLSGVYPGDTVRVTVGDRSEEFIVKGIVDSKIDMVSMKVFIPELEFRRLFDRADHNANQIIVKLGPGHNEFDTEALLEKDGVEQYAEIETFAEGTPKFISDVVSTFDIVSLFVGFIGIAVASITVFIVIFINALSRKRQIGILKAVGITGEAITFAYVTQAAFYATVGSIIGVCITAFILIPYFVAHPIDFPYGDASLSITPSGALVRCALLFVITLVAGFLPAWLIVRQNTLHSILGKK